MTRTKRRILVFVALILATVLCLLTWFAPRLVQSWLLAQARAAGLPGLQLEVRSVGWGHIDLVDLRLPGGGVEIPALTVDFSPLGLVRGEVRRIVVSAPTVRVEAGPDGWTIPGLTEFLRRPATGGPPTWPFGELRVHHLRLRVKRGDTFWEIPLDLAAVRRPGRAAVYDLNAVGTLAGRAWNLQGDLSPSGDGNVRLHAPAWPLDTLAAELGLGGSALVHGDLPLHIAAVLRDWRPDRARLEVAQTALRAAAASTWLQGRLAATAEFGPDLRLTGLEAHAEVADMAVAGVHLRAPLEVRLTGRSLDVLHLDVRRLQPAEWPARLERLQAEIQGLPETCLCRGTFHGLLPAVFPIVPGGQSLPLRGEFSLRALPGPLQWEVRGSGGSAVRLAGAGVTASFRPLSLDFQADDRGGRAWGRAALRGREGEIRWGDFSFSAGRMDLEGSASAGAAGRRFDGGRLRVRDGRFHSVDDVLQAHGIDLDLPWRRLAHAAADDGRIHIDSIRVGGMDLHDISATMARRGQGFRLDGTAQLPLPGMACTLSGTGDPAGTEIALTLTLPPHTVPPASELARLHPLLQGFSGGGRVSGQVRLGRLRGAFTAGAELQVQGAEIALPALALTCSGVDSHLHITDLTRFASAPEQRLTFQTARFGTLEFRMGEVRLTLEGDGVILLESASAAWCGGKISLSPLRWRGGGTPLAFTVHCDRLRFADLLNTLTGKTVAFGEAEINGVIPIRLENGDIKVENGYLYTTPGRRGNLRFTDAAAISGGLPLVEEAVRDFNYEWLRVSLNSRNRRLYVNVELNGAPAGKLPLEYDAKSRNFVRSRDGARRVELEGLLLELKFVDIDLPALLRYGAEMQRMNHAK